MAQADPRVEEFIHAYDRADPLNLSFDNPLSPLYPYRERHFDEGLSQTDHEKLRRLQESGDCDGDLRDLTLKGFVGLYPHLQTVIEDRERGPGLAAIIKVRLSAVFWRCWYFRQRNELASWYDVNSFPPIDNAPRGQNLNFDLQDPAQVFAWYEWKSISYILGNLAFCLSYPPSILDVWKRAGRNGGLSYSAEESVYLLARAARHNLISQSEL